MVMGYSSRHLEEALDFERSENNRLAHTASEFKSKFERAVLLQGDLERDMEDRDKHIAALTAEVASLRKSKHQIESEFAELTMNHINGQAKYMEQTALLNDEVTKLKRELKAANARAAEAESSAHAAKLAQEAHAALSEGHKVQDSAQRRGSRNDEENASSDNEQAAPKPTAQLTPPKSTSKSTSKSDSEHSGSVYSSIESEQMVDHPRARVVSPSTALAAIPTVPMQQHSAQLLIKELKQRHEQLKSEIDGIRNINSTLQEENEQFQILLAQKTIQGDMDLEISDTESIDDKETTIKAAPGAGLTFDEPKPAVDPIESRLKFKIRSLENHNEALKVSLERLVQRLLEDEKFSKKVEESVDRSAIASFSKRVASQAGNHDFQTHDPQNQNQSGARNFSNSGRAKVSASQWSRWIFNHQLAHTQNATGKRVVTMGVDDTEIKQFPLPLPTPKEQETTSTSAQSPQLSPQSDEDASIHLPKRRPSLASSH